MTFTIARFRSTLAVMALLVPALAFPQKGKPAPNGNSQQGAKPPAATRLGQAQESRPARRPVRKEEPAPPPLAAVPPNPPGSIKADLTLIKSSKDAGLVKLLLDYLPGEEVENTQDLSTLFFWDLGSGRQVQATSRIRFYYSELRRTPEGLREFQTAKPMRGPIEVQNTSGEGKPAQSVLDRLAIVFVPRVEVYQVKGDGGDAPGKRFFQYVPATVVVHDKIFAPVRESSFSHGILPNLQVWRTALEHNPLREELEMMFRYMKPSIDCQNCLDEDKVLAVVERPDFGKYLEDCKTFWGRVRQQWAIKQ